jgi:hypothetical protein
MNLALVLNQSLRFQVENRTNLLMGPSGPRW